MIAFDETFWVGAATVIFVALVFKPVSRAICAALDKRSVAIQAELDEASRLKEEAQQLLAQYKRRQQEVLEQADGIVKHAEEEAQRLLKDAESELEASLNARIEKSIQKISLYEESVKQELYNHAVDAITQTVRNLTTEKMTEEVSAKLVDNALGSIKQKLN